jgi:hypothetical protein
VLLALMALAGVCFGHTVHYAVGLNDFWYLNFLGLQVDPGDLATWRNGFYPWGTALLYAAFAPFTPLVSMTYLSLAMAMLCVTTIHVSARRLAGTRTANAASVVLLLSPWFMVYAVTQTPDMATMTLLTLGVALLLVSRRPGTTQLVVAALALGLAGALRAHTALITLLDESAYDQFGLDNQVLPYVFCTTDPTNTIHAALRNWTPHDLGPRLCRAGRCTPLV